MTTKTAKTNSAAAQDPKPDLTLPALKEPTQMAYLDVVVEADSIAVFDDYGEEVGVVEMTTAGRTSTVRIPVGAAVFPLDHKQFEADLISDMECVDLSKVTVSEVREVSEALAGIQGPLARAARDLVDLLSGAKSTGRVVVSSPDDVAEVALQCLKTQIAEE